MTPTTAGQVDDDTEFMCPPPRRRPGLLLRDVLRLRATETPATTTTAVNGLLPRARARVAPAQDATAGADSAEQRALLDRYGKRIVHVAALLDVRLFAAFGLPLVLPGPARVGG